MAGFYLNSTHALDALIWVVGDTARKNTAVANPAVGLSDSYESLARQDKTMDLSFGGRRSESEEVQYLVDGVLRGTFTNGAGLDLLTMLRHARNVYLVFTNVKPCELTISA